MLQQTQVDRVVPKFREFIRRFPSFSSLARASTREVLRTWQGLGYNRRALMLHRAARQVCDRFGGRLPREPHRLRALPGIGAATAASIAAFAFDKPTVFVETNIRAVFIHHFFPARARVADAHLLPLVEQTLDRKNPSHWYNALMDYGVALKKAHANPARRSAHHARQAPFSGSDRQIRGRILKILLSRKAVSHAALRAQLGVETKRLRRILGRLMHEGFVRRTVGGYAIA